MKYLALFLSATLAISGCDTPGYTPKNYGGSAADLTEVIDAKYGGSGAKYLAQNPAAFHDAARLDRVDLFDVFVKKGVDPDYRNSVEPWTPLYRTMLLNNEPATDRLVALGADGRESNAFYAGYWMYLNLRNHSTFVPTDRRDSEEYLASVHQDMMVKLTMMRLAYQAGDRRFWARSTIDENFTLAEPSSTGAVKNAVNVGAYGGLLMAEMHGQSDVAKMLRNQGVRKTSLSSAQRAALNLEQKSWDAYQKRIADGKARQAQAVARERAEARAAEQNGSGFNLGQLIAAGAVVAGAGHLASNGATDQAGQVLGAGLADILGDGSSSHLQNLNTGQSSSQSSSRPTSSSSAQVAATDHSGVCPGTNSRYTIKITGQSPQCRQAQKTYGHAASCNLIDELQAAEKNYYSICAGEIYGN